MNYLITLFSKTQPRRDRAIANILQNRRTVANLFWAQAYGLMGWFGAYPHLDGQAFNELLSRMQKSGELELTAAGLILTAKGAQHRQTFITTHYQPHFFKWYWLANPQKVESVTLLAIQCLSEMSAHHRRFAPLAVAPAAQRIVRRWLIGRSKALIQTAEQECLTFGKILAQWDDRLANLFAYQLVGFKTSGWSHQQAAGHLKVSVDEINLMNRDLWLAFALFCRVRRGAFSELIGPLMNSNPLSNSANQTLQAFNGGQAINVIAQYRRLKVSTVREHLISAAILTPKQLNWDRALPVKERRRLGQQYRGQPTSWHFQIDKGQDKATAFFYFRLFQIWEGKDDCIKSD